MGIIKNTTWELWVLNSVHYSNRMYILQHHKRVGITNIEEVADFFGIADNVNGPVVICGIKKFMYTNNMKRA